MPLLKLFSSVRLVEEISRTDHSNDRSHPSRRDSMDDDNEMTLPSIPRPSRHAMPTLNKPATPLSHPNRSTKPRSGRRHSRARSLLTRKGLFPFFFGSRPSSKYYSYAKKAKSQRLLSLWPLPVITRYTILLSCLISTLNALQWIQLSCSAPKYVLFRHEILNLLLSPFLFNFTLHDVMLFAWNVLILGLFEESLTSVVGGTRRFLRIVLTLVLAVCTIRQGLGYVFSKSTGYAIPALFFSDSIHECSQGLAPFLFSLLVIQSVSIDDKYVLIYDLHDDETNRMTIRKVTLQLFMLLVNYTVKNILWWSMTGLLTGYMAVIVIQATMPLKSDTSLLPDADNRSHDDLYAISLPLNHQDEKCLALPSPKRTPLWYPRRVPLWRILWSAVQRGSLVLFFTLPLLLLFNIYYQQEHFIDELTLNSTITDHHYLFTMMVMTAPRRGDPTYLTTTLQSYLDQWPLLPQLPLSTLPSASASSAVASSSPMATSWDQMPVQEEDNAWYAPLPDTNTVHTTPPLSLHDRLQIIVYTHFTNHPEYDRARAKFTQDPKGQRYIRWVQHGDNEWNHRRHIASALQHALQQEKSSAYVAMLEDDFPICGRRAWREIENIIYLANTHMPHHCGVFVGTGGSGLFLKPHVAKLASQLLFKYVDMPPDIVIQQCLLGKLPECVTCSQQLVISKTLLMHHIGYNTSTSSERSYNKNEFQCNWRHPFNGDPDVAIL
ncbi:hypothetical protein DM01DRAFT_1307372 [Hesseltinella vesiculosa]|uniref:Uncharacterized protein n=1 Tax=Hesseltinella vesiculosa TaxID=101127 RepID=A0A1X2GDX6_9FUNG|nr:hypothetical protein DM01DRAFT_1307372 [Hesseltinella vesiculosa]